MTDFTRTKFEWGFRDAYLNGDGYLEYTNRDGRYCVYLPNGVSYDVSCVRAGRSIIRTQ